jgi:hypothetical protein
MPDINITVAHKVAVSDTQSIVCDNSDYTVHWTLDEDWSAYDTKTMRTIYMDGTFTDKVFSGAEVELPVCTVPGVVQIGLFAGDIRTSRVAILRALPSVRSAAGAPDDPPESVYDQLMERMAQLETSDWAQNDPTAKDYVRNRTHYVSQENGVIVPEQEVTTAVQNNFNLAVLTDADLDAFQKLYNSKADTTFDVVFDGKSYKCKWLEQGGNRIPVFGNLAISNPDIPDTGEPFCVTPNKNPHGGNTLLIGCKVAGTHTVAVSYQQDVVHTLDPKYIKDMYHAEMRESKVGTDMSGWWNVTSGGSNPVIPKMSVGGVVYENLSPSKVDDIDYYYTVGDYTFRFHAAQGEEYRYLAITPYYEGDYDEIIFYTLIEDVMPIPEKYMPDFVRSGSLVSLVTAVEPGHSTTINARGVDRNTLVVFMVTTGSDIAPQSSIIDSSGTKYPIYSARTGAEISDAEHPRGVMLLKYAYERWWCINPA